MISEYSKLTQKKYKTRLDWVGKMIQWELCKKFKFNYTARWYVHNPKSLRENETHKILRDLEIQWIHLITVRRLDLTIVIKKREPDE